ncbi:TMAO/DMSO reductase [Polystyrenella longa]|uniref:TMAO/DMSO reductase n=1 Tax=Polystyrenella longa TaxID=2528007 RepID=A0A518CQD0_9PLAN|nr:sulfite oxidase-like oxidoreductase [Polystyrenella longa]QDU81432.1 TMAO/DMSO reductase [Polystyrenella longa]
MLVPGTAIQDAGPVSLLTEKIARRMLQDDKYQAGEPALPEEISDAEIIISSDTRRENRIPPNQVRTRKWPVLQAGVIPVIEPESWSLEVTGLVEHPFQLNWAQFKEMSRVRVFSDFHCVTRWSRLGNVWEGVSTAEIAQRAGIRPEAKFVVAHAFDDSWSTNLPLEQFLSPDALLVDLHDGEPLTADHGAPVRLVVPLLYAWKSAKWLKGIEFVAEDKPGYWERVGYHHHGDPWKEERFEGDQPDSYSDNAGI